MTIELTATKTNLNALLGVPGQQFAIPEYQRPYAWGEPQVDELWDDLLESLGVGHFMGSLVLNVEDENRPQVIDGQQRLTTLAVLLALIRDRYHDLGSQYSGQPDQLLLNSFAQGNAAFKLRSGGANWPVLRDFILRSPMDDSRKVLSQLSALDKSARLRNKRLVSNTKRLARLLDTYVAAASSPEAALYALESHIRTGLEFVAIKVSNVADAFLLFETLNDRGLQLSAADLLKSHLLSQIAQESSDDAATQEAAQIWDDMIEALGGVDVTRFLRHFLLMAHAKVRKDDVFPRFKDDVKAVGASKLLHRISEFAVDYGRLMDPSKIDDAKVSGAVAQVHGQNSVTHFVLLLPALHYLEPQAFAKVCRTAEILSFRWVVCGLNAQELESTYAKAAKLLDQSQGSEVDEVLALMRSVLPPSEQFREGFRQARMGVKYVTRYVLASIERALNPSGELKPSDEVHIEHIMPQAKTVYWEQRVEDEDAYRDLVARWGNLTLLHQSPNQEISNGPYDIKRNLYRASDLRITRQLAELGDWDEDAIDMRQRWLAVIADQLWDPDFVPSKLDVPSFPYKDPTLEQKSLEALIAAGESQELEFKQTARWDLREKQRADAIEHATLRTIAGLANAVGGTLLIGVSDDGTISGIEPDLKLFKPEDRTADQFMLWLNGKVKQHLGMAMATQIETQAIDTDKGVVCRVDVPEAPQPVYLRTKQDRDEFHVRMNNETQQLEGRAMVEYIDTHWS
jgi:hypothetical protein